MSVQINAFLAHRHLASIHVPWDAWISQVLVNAFLAHIHVHLTNIIALHDNGIGLERVYPLKAAAIK
jgi:hypothetical protein